MDYVKQLAELREQINGTKSDDLAKTNLYYREIKNELIMKREQVLQLRKELDAANASNFEFNRELDNNKSVRKETEFNLKLALKKAATAEEKYKEIHEAFTDLKLKEQLRLSEIDILKDSAHKKAQENHRLSRELNELKDKLQYMEAYQSELDERQAKINSTIVKTKIDAEKLEVEHSKLLQLEHKLQTADEYKKMHEAVMHKYERLKNDYWRLDEVCIEMTAKYDKLSSLINAHKSIGLNQQNPLLKIKFLQWENRCKRFQEENILNQEKITTLSETLNREIEANAYLLMEIEDYQQRIKDLEEKLNETKP